MTDYTLTLNVGQNPSFKMILDKDFSSDKHILDAMRNGCCYESEVVLIMSKALREGDTVFDLGANVGYFSLLSSVLVGPTGRVLAFEPGENNLPRLRDNILLNRFDNIDVITRPVWSHQTELTFWLNHDNSGGNALWDPALWPNNPKSKAAPVCRRLQTTTLDRVYLTVPRLIKMDIEGAEYHALVGAHGLLKAHRPEFIVVEWNRFALAQMETSGENIRRLLRTYGYEMFLIDATGHKPVRLAHTQKLDLPDGIIVNVLFSTEKLVDEIWEKQDAGAVG